SGRLLIQQLQISGFRIDGECADRPAVFSLEGIELAHGVKEATIRMNGQERRVLGLCRQGSMAQLTPGRVKIESINPLAVTGASRVSSDKNPKLSRRLSFGDGRQQGQERQTS